MPCTEEGDDDEQEQSIDTPDLKTLVSHGHGDDEGYKADDKTLQRHDEKKPKPKPKRQDNDKDHHPDSSFKLILDPSVEE